MNGCLNIVAPSKFISAKTILLVTALDSRELNTVCRAYLPKLSLFTKYINSKSETTRLEGAVRAI